MPLFQDSLSHQPHHFQLLIQLLQDIHQVHLKQLLHNHPATANFHTMNVIQLTTVNYKLPNGLGDLIIDPKLTKIYYFHPENLILVLKVALKFMLDKKKHSFPSIKLASEQIVMY